MTRTKFYEKWASKLQDMTDWPKFAADIKSIKDEPVADYLDEKCNEALLTSTEREIAKLLLRGLTAAEMASQTGIKELTVKHHIAAVFHKFDVANRTELYSAFFPL